MNRHIKRVLAMSILMLGLAFPTPTPRAQEDSFDPNAVTAMPVRRIRQARITRAQAKTIRTMETFERSILVKGNLIRPINGYQLWLLSNGSIGVFEPDTTIQAMESFTKVLDGVVVYAIYCYCPGGDPNVDDGCKFNPPGNPGGPCVGPECCSKVEVVVDEHGNGKVTIL